MTAWVSFRTCAPEGIKFICFVTDQAGLITVLIYTGLTTLAVKPYGTGNWADLPNKPRLFLCRHGLFGKATKPSGY